MPDFGVTSEGFVTKRLADIRASLTTRFRGEFGDDIKTGPRSVFGQLIAIFSNVVARQWELLALCFFVLDPDQASGVWLENLAKIIGLERLDELASRATLSLGGDIGTEIPSGSIVRHDVTGEPFATVEAVTLADDGAGNGVATVEALAVEKGPVVALAGSLTDIDTPITGWDSVTNPSDAVVGRESEKDPELRLRMRNELQRPGSTSIGAIRARIVELEGVESANVLQNVELETDADGLIGKSIEAVVIGGDDEAIARLIMEHKAGGMKAASTAEEAPELVEVVVVDSEGEEHAIAFTRPEELEVWIKVEVEAPEMLTLAELDDIAADVLKRGEALAVGDNVLLWRMAKAAAVVEGVEDVTVFAGLTEIGVVAENVEVSKRQIARIDSARIEVVQL